MHNTWFFSWISFCLLTAVNASAETKVREYDFDHQWRMHAGEAPGAEAPDYDDSTWENITLPRAWNEDESFKVHIHDHSTGVAWYRKRFLLPTGAEQGKVFLEFEGVRQGARVYVNGKEAGRHHNGVMAFGVDITELVLPAPQENTIAVWTDNDWRYRDDTGSRFQWSDHNFNANFGGITKSVRLHTMGKVYQTLPLYSNLGTTGVYIYASDFDIRGAKAVIHAESEVKNESNIDATLQYKVSVHNPQGDLVAEWLGDQVQINAGETGIASASKLVEGLHFWSWGYGYLYDVQTSLLQNGQPIDSVTTRTGFRKTATQNGMFYLNDRVLQVKGYAQRSTNEWPAIGWPGTPWLCDFSNQLIVDSNANTVRWMHITPSKEDIESCDRVGLMMLMPAGDAEADVSGRRWEQRVELMRDAVIYNRNNPSVVFLEGGNEAISEEHMAELTAVRDKYDPHGGRLSGSREMLDSKIAEWGGEMLYINKSADIPLFATEYCRDEALRKYWDDWSPPFHKDGDGPLHRDKPANAYNRNQDSFAVEEVIRWYDYWEARPGTGSRVSSGGLNICFSDTNTYGRGAENYRRSGEVDAMRIPKDAFFAHQVMWDGWVDTDNYAAHILGHWNYEPGVQKPVYVVSTADRVKLFLNDKFIGEAQQSYRFLFTLPNVEWQPGTLKAVGYSNDGHQLCEKVVQTAGTPTSLKISHWQNPAGIRADGADLVLVQVEVVDQQGRRCPTSMAPIEFNLSGPAEWRGGLAQGREDNYILKKKLPAECGVCRVLLRTSTTPGKINLSASMEGVNKADLALVSESIDLTGGLSTDFPQGFPPYLGCGPTPHSPSYKPTRHSVKIVKAEAGSSPKDAGKSFDDNELSVWNSSVQPEGAWIRYHFDGMHEIDQVCLKMADWRAARYGMRIKVGDQEVWQGKTPPSLGYITLQFPSTQGASLTIQADHPSTLKDGFSEIVEVTGEVHQSTRRNRGRLRIVEAEVYETKARSTE